MTLLVYLTTYPYIGYQSIHTSNSYILTLYIVTGDSNKEELLTVEYFKLLNEKNVLIKKQIELNLL